MNTDTPIEKAGAIVMRLVHGKVYIYVVHRHRYNDWSLPKGHVDDGESMEQAALREIEEETGMRCHIVSTLPDYGYQLPDGRESVVKMFLMEMEAVIGGVDETEVDMGRWVLLDEAVDAISYPSLATYVDELKHDVILTGQRLYDERLRLPNQ